MPYSIKSFIKWQYEFLYSIRLAYITDQQGKDSYIYIPICHYNEKNGLKVKGYEETFCSPRAFQPTFNEYGMCFTFNNHKQGMDEYFNTTDFQNDILEQNQVIRRKLKTNNDYQWQINSDDEEYNILKVRNDKSFKEA